MAGWQKYFQTENTTTGDYDVSFSRCVCNKSINKTERRCEVNEWVRVVASEVGGPTPFFEKREKTYKRRQV